MKSATKSSGSTKHKSCVFLVLISTLSALQHSEWPQWRLRPPSAVLAGTVQEKGLHSGLGLQERQAVQVYLDRFIVTGLRIHVFELSTKLRTVHVCLEPMSIQRQTAVRHGRLPQEHLVVLDGEVSGGWH